MSDLVRLEVRKTNRFKTIDLNAIDNDPEMSWRAKGIWVYLVSRPPGWKFYFSDLLKRSTDGKTSVRNGVKELQERGYLLIQKIQDQKGRWVGAKWIVTEDPGQLPLPAEAIAHIENVPEPEVQDTRRPEDPDSGENDPSIYHSQEETSLKSKSLKEMQRKEKALPTKSKKRKSLKGLSRAEVIDLYNNDKSEPPRGYTRPQVLAAILDHTKGMNDIVNEIGWPTIMMRLGQLFNRRRKVLLEYRDFMDVAIGLTEIPQPKNGKASIDYLVGMLTHMALELHIKRAEQEAQQYKTDKVEEIISDLANKMRMDT